MSFGKGVSDSIAAGVVMAFVTGVLLAVLVLGVIWLVL